MNQNELDEISEAFKEAWTDYFGDELYYVPFDSVNTVADDIYLEQVAKKYDYTNKVLFHGTLKEVPSMDELHTSGKAIKKEYTISFVTKELVDAGVNYIDTKAIIMYTDRFGKETKYRMFDDFQKVQFSDNKIFTNMKVIPYE